MARNTSGSAVPLTSEHYGVRRGDYARVSRCGPRGPGEGVGLEPYPALIPQVEELDLQEFRSVLGERVVTDPTELESYNTDWLGNLRLP